MHASNVESIGQGLYQYHQTRYTASVLHSINKKRKNVEG